jgi:hypothetical protein
MGNRRKTMTTEKMPSSTSVHADVRRRIVQASLCLRFYRSAGWTREEVRQLLREDKRLARVFPRYFDERDKAGRGGFELDDGLPHDECDYFAVYGVSEPFSAEALALHDVV